LDVDAAVALGDDLSAEQKRTMNGTIEQLQNQRLQDLANRPGNVVYRYAYNEPEKAASASQVLTLARDLFLRRQAMLAVTSDDNDARARLKREDLTFALFSRTHPVIFERMTDGALGSQHFEILQEMGAVRRQVESGADEAQANVTVSSLILQRATAHISPESTA
jgi:hypothetical protein